MGLGDVVLSVPVLGLWVFTSSSIHILLSAVRVF